MPEIPRDRWPESTPALLIEGYKFISNRCRRYQSDIFEARLLLRKTICLKGEDAARLFYDTEKFQRQGAAPMRLKNTLFGWGGIQGLDGEKHRSRKQMFMSLMTPKAIRRLVDPAGQWSGAIGKWENMGRVVLFDEVNEILSRAVCTWAGVPLEESQVGLRTDDLVSLIESPAAIGPRHWRGMLARIRSEKWAGGIINDVRSGRLDASEGSAVYVIGMHRDPDGKMLSRHTASVELLNVLRPTVAVSRFITFAALALHQYPECRRKLLEDKDDYAELFVQEVRRYYPFFPAVAARVRHYFEWKGYRFPKGQRVVLDLYGTDHDPQLWDKPEEFLPERFRKWEGNAYSFIPQGGSDHYTNHRCPGEWLTKELMKTAVDILNRSMEYEVPPQNLHVSLSKMPALPKSGFVISGVRRIG